MTAPTAAIELNNTNNMTHVSTRASSMSNSENFVDSLSFNQNASIGASEVTVSQPTTTTTTMEKTKTTDTTKTTTTDMSITDTSTTATTKLTDGNITEGAIPQDGRSLEQVVQLQDAYIRAMLAKVRLMEKQLAIENNRVLEMQHVHHLWHLQELYDMYRVMGIDAMGPLESVEEVEPGTTKTSSNAVSAATASITVADADLSEDDDRISMTSSVSGVHDEPNINSTQHLLHDHLRCHKCCKRFHTHAAYRFHLEYSLLHDRRNVSNWEFCAGCQQFYPRMTRERHIHCAAIHGENNAVKMQFNTGSSYHPSSYSDFASLHAPDSAMSVANQSGPVAAKNMTSSMSTPSPSSSNSPMPRKRRRTNSTSSSSSTGEPRKYECVKCDQVFKSHTAMSSHLRFSLQHDPANIKNWNYCAVCDKKYHPRVGTRHKQCRAILQQMEEARKLQEQRQQQQLQQQPQNQELQHLNEEETIALHQLSALHSRHDQNPLTLEREEATADEDEELHFCTQANNGSEGNAIASDDNSRQ